MMTVADYPEVAQEWLGELPNNWQVKALKFVVDTNNETLPENTDPNFEFEYADISSVELGKGIKETETLTFENAPSRARRIVRNGDTLVSTVRTYLRAITGVSEAPQNLVGSTGFAVLRPRIEIHPKYLSHFAISNCFVEAIVAQSKGVSYPATNASDIANLRIAFPSLKDQIYIAAFLDEKTAEIDGLIEKKRKLLDLLAEKRAAIITNAVTKGLNPNASMKHSGIDWLGEVPEHWELPRLQHIARLKSGESITSEDIDDNGKYPVFGGGGFRGYTDFYTHEGDFVLIGRQGAQCGNIKYAFRQFWASEHALVVHTLVPIENRWLGALLETMNLNQYSVSSAQPGLSVDNIGRLTVPLPSIDEQIEISSRVAAIQTEIDKIHETVSNAIERLSEYRLALITAAVTGKIKVT